MHQIHLIQGRAMHDNCKQLICHKSKNYYLSQLCSPHHTILITSHDAVLIHSSEIKSNPMAVTFSDLHIESGLKCLNEFLSAKTYISGYLFFFFNLYIFVHLFSNWHW